MDTFRAFLFRESSGPVGSGIKFDVSAFKAKVRMLTNMLQSFNKNQFNDLGSNGTVRVLEVMSGGAPSAVIAIDPKIKWEDDSFRMESLIQGKTADWGLRFYSFINEHHDFAAGMINANPPILIMDNPRVNPKWARKGIGLYVYTVMAKHYFIVGDHNQSSQSQALWLKMVTKGSAPYMYSTFVDVDRGKVQFVKNINKQPKIYKDHAEKYQANNLSKGQIHDFIMGPHKLKER